MVSLHNPLKQSSDAQSFAGFMTPPTMGKGPRREVGLSANNWISGGDKETIRWSDMGMGQN